MGLFDKFKKNEIRNETNDGLPPVSEKDLERIHRLLDEIKVKNYPMYEKMKDVTTYIMPLEANTSLISISEIIREMVSELHYCIEAKKRLNTISKDFLESETYKKLMYNFADGFIFDGLESFSSYSEEELKHYSLNIYFAYFCAYVLGLIDKLPENPEECSEEKLCSIITSFNNCSKIIDNCKLMSKEQILYISDYLSIECSYLVYKENANLLYDEKIKWYKRNLMICSYYILSFDFDSVMKKLYNTNQQN